MAHYSSLSQFLFARNISRFVYPLSWGSPPNQMRSEDAEVYTVVARLPEMEIILLEDMMVGAATIDAYLGAVLANLIMSYW